MKTYDTFHGDILIKNIGRELRKIVNKETKSFKIMTGYGSTTGISKSKDACLKSLSKMKKEGLIKGYLPGDIKFNSLKTSDKYYDDKIKYYELIKNDSDYGNPGIIFIFI